MTGPDFQASLPWSVSREPRLGAESTNLGVRKLAAAVWPNSANAQARPNRIAIYFPLLKKM